MIVVYKKNLKKLFVLMMAFGLVTFGNVYAEEIAVVEDVEVTEEGTIVDEDGTALAGDGSFTITDDALLTTDAIGVPLAKKSMRYPCISFLPNASIAPFVLSCA